MTSLTACIYKTSLPYASRQQRFSDAGRQLFNVSRLGKATVNDADRLRKYLARFGLSWEMLKDLSQLQLKVVIGNHLQYAPTGGITSV